MRGVRHGEALVGWVMEYGSGLLLPAFVIGLSRV